MLRPDYKEFCRLAGQATLIPVVKSVMADLLTPVSAFLAIANRESRAFLLESIERGEHIGRYTFLGARPYMELQARGENIVIRRGSRTENRSGNFLKILKDFLRQYKPASLAGLPPFTAGAVGYFAYDGVRHLENIGEHAKDDLALPDCVLMFFDRVLVFDHLLHQIHIIASADVSQEHPHRAYDRAIADISTLENKLAGGLRPGQWRKTTRGYRGKLKVHAGTSRARFVEAVERCKEYIAATSFRRCSRSDWTSSLKLRRLTSIEPYGPSIRRPTCTFFV
jgi:anthranilate synthase component 1